MSKFPDRECLYCEVEFTPQRGVQTFCSKDCRFMYNRAKSYAKKLKDPPMSRTQALVNAYLMDRSLDNLDDLIHEHFKRKVQ